MLTSISFIDNTPIARALFLFLGIVGYGLKLLLYVDKIGLF